MKKAVDGLILREAPIGENDKLLTVLTAEEGRITLTAKGARSMRSKVLSVCRLFTYGNFEYYEKNDRRWLSGGSANNSFFSICEDLERFSLASYIVQVADDITGEGVDASDVLKMTLNTLYCIEKGLKPHWQIKAAYELFAVSVSGMSPDLSECDLCGEGDKSEYWADVMNGSIMCAECMKKKNGGLPLPELDEYSARNILMPLDASALCAARYILSAPVSRIFAFTVTDTESIERLCKFAETYLLNHLERNFDTLDFYKAVVK
ncbi:MAG: DNA repair protein RecO [Clostridia bacterium]|nr:DNA repair protein RecO [Clostridia bacterium]